MGRNPPRACCDKKRRRAAEADAAVILKTAAPSLRGRRFPQSRGQERKKAVSNDASGTNDANDGSASDTKPA
jgi:hypothetical protein